MNPEDIIVRIEKIAGNFQKKDRAAIIETVGEIAKKETHQPSLPLTDDEITALRESLRSQGKKLTPAKTTKKAAAAAGATQDANVGEPAQLRPGETPGETADRPHAESPTGKKARAKSRRR